MNENLLAKEFEIKFNKKGMLRKEYICEKFGWKHVHLTVNGHCLVRVKYTDLEVFEETAKRHFFSIIKRL